MADVKTQIEELRADIIETLKIPEDARKGFCLLDRIEHVHSIYNNEDFKNFEFDDQDLRHSPFLVYLALFYFLKGHKILFISPTGYYAMQAQAMAHRVIRRVRDVKGEIAGENVFTCSIPGHESFDQLSSDADIFFMHGKDFSEYIRNAKGKHKIVQRFEGHVPVDPRPPNSCMRCCDD
jgi:hypothetical protein